jgi:hypothetical protein
MSRVIKPFFRSPHNTVGEVEHPINQFEGVVSLQALLACLILYSTVNKTLNNSKYLKQRYIQ